MTEFSRPPIRVALIGLGRAMFANHYSVYKAHPALFNVVAACDLVKERRDIVEKDFPQCKMFRTYTDLLDERDIELVDIATESSLHARMALDSLNRGRWTLVESPMALTYEDSQVLRGASVKMKNRLIVMNPGLFASDYLLAKQAMADSRLGTIHQIIIRREDFIRLDDWQAVKRLGGGAAYYAMPEMLLQALKLLPVPPIQMWSELKRLASLGDAEDYVHVELKTRTELSVELEYNGGALPGAPQPSFVINGDAGTFSVMPGAAQGRLRIIDPKFKFPRRRSSVRTPDLRDLHENIPVLDLPYTLPDDTAYGAAAFWKNVYKSVRIGMQFPIPLDGAIEALKFACLMKKASPFGMGK